jgi:choline kinase
MKLIILAAGKSSRIINHIKTNKCLIKINNLTIIEKIIKNSLKNKIKNIEVVVGYNPKKIINKLKGYKNIKFKFNKKYNTTDMVYSSILSLVNMKDDVIISYSDVYYEPELIKKIKNYKSDNILIPYTQNWKKIWKIRNKNIFNDAETFKINKKKKLIEIGNKISKKNFSKVDGQFLGLIYIPKKKIKNFIYLYKNLSQKKIQFTNFLNILISKFGHEIDTVKYTGLWYEFDDQDDLENFYKKIKNVR